MRLRTGFKGGSARVRTAFESAPLSQSGRAQTRRHQQSGARFCWLESGLGAAPGWVRVDPGVGWNLALVANTGECVGYGRGGKTGVGQRERGRGIRIWAVGSPCWTRFELFCCKHIYLRALTSQHHKVSGWDFPVIPDRTSGWRHSEAPGRISPMGISDPSGLRIFVASSAQAEVVGLSLTVVTAEGRRGSGKVGSLAASPASE